MFGASHRGVNVDATAPYFHRRKSILIWRGNKWAQKSTVADQRTANEGYTANAEAEFSHVQTGEALAPVTK